MALLFTFEDKHFKEVPVRPIRASKNTPLIVMVLLQERVFGTIGPDTTRQTIADGFGFRYLLDALFLDDDGSSSKGGTIILWSLSPLHRGN